VTYGTLLVVASMIRARKEEERGAYDEQALAEIEDALKYSADRAVTGQ
jgi:hypothetical protein